MRVSNARPASRAPIAGLRQHGRVHPWLATMLRPQCPLARRPPPGASRRPPRVRTFTTTESTGGVATTLAARGARAKRPPSRPNLASLHDAREGPAEGLRPVSRLANLELARATSTLGSRLALLMTRLPVGPVPPSSRTRHSSAGLPGEGTETIGTSPAPRSEAPLPEALVVVGVSACRSWSP